MLERILKRPVTVLMFYFTVLVLMIFSLTRLPIEMTPEVDFPRLNVVTQWYGASPELIERFVTIRIEEVATTVTGVKRVSSWTREGTSWVEVEFQKDVDIDLARLELSEKISSVYKTFPQGVSYPQIQKFVPSEFQELQGFMSFSVYGDADIYKIQKIIDETIKPALLGIKGVANVRTIGEVKREILILLDENKVKSYKLNLVELIRAINENQIFKLVGYADLNNVRHFVYSGDYFNNVDDVKEMKIRVGEGRYLKLSEFAVVVDTIAEQRSFARINGKPTLTIEIDKEPGINMLKVARQVDELIDNLKEIVKSRYGVKVEIDKIYDRSKDIRAEISELGNKALISALFIVLILVLFLRNVISSFLVFLSVAFSVAGAVVFLYVSGIGLNIMSLSALALSFGIVIDNSVVVFENIQRHFEEEGEIDFNLILTAVQEMKLPVISASLTTIGALVPVFLLPENLKPYFIHFSITAGFVILFSLFISLTFIPIVSDKILVKRRFKERVKLFDVILNIYKKILLWNIKHRRLVVIVLIWLFGFPIWLLPEKIEIKGENLSLNVFDRKVSVSGFVKLYNEIIGGEFYSKIRPYVDHALGGVSHLFFKYVYKGELWRWGGETYIVVSIFAPQGTEISRIDELVRKIEGNLVKNLGLIKKFTSRVSDRYAMIRVEFDDKVAMTSVPYIIKENLISICAQTSGFTTSVYGFGPGFFSGGDIAPSFTIQILGYNYDVVKQIAQNISEILSQNPRVADIELDRLPWRAKEYEVVAYIDREKLSRYGVDVSDLIYFIAGKLRVSVENLNLRLQNEDVKLKIAISESGRNLKDVDVRELLDASLVVKGKSVKLSDILSIELAPTMPEIRRENQQYTRYITFNFRGPYHYGYKFTDAVIKSVKVPPGYEIKRPDYFFIIGEKERIPLILIAFVSVLIVFMITASLYESLRKPFVIILSVPMSLIGLFLVFYIFDVNFGRGGYAGLILLIGLSVNNGIILVDKISKALESRNVKPHESSYDEVIAHASLQRVRPILITNLTTIAGFLPFIFTKNVYSLWYPFSVAVSGGLLFSMFVILLFVPSLYKIIAK
jgi:hydrophobic/amphiphilic exporter-1 (mainly G- bacteria), HAE1 family